MNNLYSFILGHSPKLSQAEIESVLNLQKISFQIIDANDIFLILEIKEELNIEDLNKNLGGIKKIGEFSFLTENLDNFADMENILWKDIQENCNLESKIKFGFSQYSKDKKINNLLNKTSINLKKKLKEEGISSRFVTSREAFLSAVIVQKEHLIQRGIEWQVLKSKGKIYFFKTKAVQDFTRFNALDYDRPRIDSKSGMTPPKLAKIMLNLSQSRKVLLDPFCGSGTILLMAEELGFEKIIGSDISEKAVQDSIENLKWYKERFNKNTDSYIFKADVKNLILEGLEKNSVDCIVSEGYLGKPLRGHEDFSFIKEQISGLRDLYLDSFKVFKDLLKNKGCVIITLPIFMFNNSSPRFAGEARENHLEIVDEIKKIGFQQENLLENEQSLIYKREGQRVYREIIKFIKN